jgi:hypothetical protein
MDIHDIRDKVLNGRFLLTEHADEQRNNDNLSVDDLISAILGGEILEEYFDDPRGPECLIRGLAQDKRVTSLVVGYADEGNVIIITVYVRRRRGRR